MRCTVAQLPLECRPETAQMPLRRGGYTQGGKMQDGLPSGGMSGGCAKAGCALDSSESGALLGMC
eukprot:8553879-Alexandrium_andersonii.AAC.1